MAQQVVVSSPVQELAAQLLPRTPELARDMAEHLYTAIPDLAATGDEDLRHELTGSTASNIGQILRLLASGAGLDDVAVPREALEYLRGNVRRGISLAALLRSYRLGHAWLWERWFQELQEAVDDPAELVAASDATSAFMFAYIDAISDQLVEEFGSERERMMRGAAQLRAETVRELLAGEPIDEEVASRRLGYELRRHHIALRVAGTGSEVRGLERTVNEAVACLGPGEPLVMPTGAARFDVWWCSFERPDTTALEAYEPPAGVVIAFGTSAPGVAGFRRSHTEALQAARVCSLARNTGRTVTSYARVELVALLSGDLERARAFVSGQLGPLAASTESAARLRETVLAFLTSGGSATRVSRELFVHQNTVAYRVKRAEELLGRRVSENPVELTCALTLAAALGASVLPEDDAPDALSAPGG